MRFNSSTFADRMLANTRIVPIKPQHRVKTVMKLATGALQVELHSGESFEVAPDEPLFQSFIVYTVLADYT